MENNSIRPKLLPYVGSTCWTRCGRHIPTCRAPDSESRNWFSGLGATSTCQSSIAHPGGGLDRVIQLCAISICQADLPVLQQSAVARHAFRPVRHNVSARYTWGPGRKVTRRPRARGWFLVLVLGSGMCTIVLAAPLSSSDEPTQRLQIMALTPPYLKTTG